MSKRRWLVLIILPLVALGGCASLIDYMQQPPTRERAAEEMIFGGELFAYEVLHGTPHVAFRMPRGGKLIIDHLRLDWVSIEFPPAPAWQQTGNWYGTAMSSDPASVAVTVRAGGEWHQHVEIFGQINATEIVAIEVRIGDDWHHYAVAPPGYIVSLDGVPEAYRWLDASGEVVWAKGD